MFGDGGNVSIETVNCQATIRGIGGRGAQNPEEDGTRSWGGWEGEPKRRVSTEHVWQVATNAASKRSKKAWIKVTQPLVYLSKPVEAPTA